MKARFPGSFSLGHRDADIQSPGMQEYRLPQRRLAEFRPPATISLLILLPTPYRGCTRSQSKVLPVSKCFSAVRNQATRPK